MKAIVLTEPGRLSLADVNKPQLPRDGVVLFTKQVSICSTDVAYYNGTLKPPQYPVILGHEYVGQVVEKGPDAHDLKLGSHVVYFGDTDFGGLTQYRALRLAAGAATPADEFFTDRYFMDDRRAAFVVLDENADLSNVTLIEPMTAVLRALHSHPPKPGSSCLILGGGPCGYIAGLLMKNLFAVNHIGLVEKNPVRAQLALEAFADEWVNAEQAYPSDVGTEKFDFVFDALPEIRDFSVVSPRRIAMQLVRPGSKYLLYGASDGEQLFDTWLMLSKGISIVSAPFDVRVFPMQATTAIMNVAAKLLTTNYINLAPITRRIENVWNVESISKIFDNYAADDHMKTILEFHV